MRLIIAGSRRVKRGTGVEIISRAFGYSPFDLAEVNEVVHGGATGIDELADSWARIRGIKVTVFPADWSFGKGAGPMRNQKMVKYASAALAIRTQEHSPGTSDLLQKAMEAYGSRWTFLYEEIG